MDLNKNEDARTAQLLQLLMLIALNYYVAEVFLFVIYLKSVLRESLVV